MGGSPPSKSMYLQNTDGMTVLSGRICRHGCMHSPPRQSDVVVCVRWHSSHYSSHCRGAGFPLAIAIPGLEVHEYLVRVADKEPANSGPAEPPAHVRRGHGRHTCLALQVIRYCGEYGVFDALNKARESEPAGILERLDDPHVVDVEIHTHRRAADKLGVDLCQPRGYERLCVLHTDSPANVSPGGACEVPQLSVGRRGVKSRTNNSASCNAFYRNDTFLRRRRFLQRGAGRRRRRRRRRRRGRCAWAWAWAIPLRSGGGRPRYGL